MKGSDWLLVKLMRSSHAAEVLIAVFWMLCEGWVVGEKAPEGRGDRQRGARSGAVGAAKHSHPIAAYRH